MQKEEKETYYTVFFLQLPQTPVFFLTCFAPRKSDHPQQAGGIKVPQGTATCLVDIVSSHGI